MQSKVALTLIVKTQNTNNNCAFVSFFKSSRVIAPQNMPVKNNAAEKDKPEIITPSIIQIYKFFFDFKVCGKAQEECTCSDHTNRYSGQCRGDHSQPT